MQQQDHPTSWEEVGHAYERMFWPLLLVWADVHLTLDRTRIELLPDVLAWLWMAAVLRPIVPAAAIFAKLRGLAFCLGAFSIPAFIRMMPKSPGGIHLKYPGAAVPTDIPSLVYDVSETAALILHGVFIWYMLSSVMKIGVAAGDAALVAKADVCRWLTVLLLCGSFLTPWALLPETPKIVLLLFVMLMWIVAAIVTLSVRGQTAHICRSPALNETQPGPILETMETSTVTNTAYPPQGNEKRIRFSLLTLILTTTIVALAASQYQLLQANKEAQERIATANEAVEFYQNRYDNIYVRDREKIYARSVPMPDKHTWRWRVYLPPRTTHALRARASQVPKEGFPENHQLQLVLPQDEVSITAQFHETDSGDWKLTVEAVSESGPTHTRFWNGVREVIDGRPRWTASYTLEQGEADWLINPGGWSGSEASDEVTEFEPDEPILLLRCRTHQSTPTGPTSWRSAPPEGTSNGVAVWITPVP